MADTASGEIDPYSDEALATDGLSAARRRPAASASLRTLTKPGSALSDVVFLLAIASVTALGLYLLILSLPKLKEVDGTEVPFSPSLLLPSSLEQLQATRQFLENYRDQQPVRLLSVFCYVYLFKQTFSIPGSVLLNTIAGALFGWLGFPLVVVLTGMGTSCCYWLSALFARRLVASCLVSQFVTFERIIRERSQRGDLFWYLLGVRLFPVTPNWLINILSPLLNVPYPSFVLSVLIGLAPYNAACVSAGAVLSTLNSVSDIVTTSTVLKLMGLAALAILPTQFKSRFQ